MESPGKCLKRERDARNLTLREVSASTRIKEHILGAIEQDRYDLCPPPFYVKGFLTNYARYLGIDPQDVLLKYQEFVKPPVPPPEAMLQEKPKETFLSQSRVQTRTVHRVLLVSALLVSLLIPLYFLYTFQTGNSPGLVALTQTKPVTPEVAPEKGSPAAPSQETVILEVAPEKRKATRAASNQATGVDRPQRGAGRILPQGLGSPSGDRHRPGERPSHGRRQGVRIQVREPEGLLLFTNHDPQRREDLSRLAQGRRRISPD